MEQEDLIIFRCLGCRLRMEAPVELAGHTIACPNCSRKLLIPSPVAEGIGRSADPEAEEKQEPPEEQRKGSTKRINVDGAEVPLPPPRVMKVRRST